MKILAVQLLRLGDVICLGPAVSQLRKKYPDAQIDLLINDSAVKAAPLFTDIQNTFVFERTVIQSGLGEVERNLFESFDRVQELVTELDRQNYDLVINFTQNKLSARLIGLIRCREKIGMSYESGRWTFNNSFFQALNKDPQALTREFHFSDIFRLAVDVESDFVCQQFRETVQGKIESQQVLSNKKTIAFQPLTSDLKKNWPIEKFAKLYKILSVFYPTYDFVFLGAPDEKQVLAQGLASVLENSNCHLEILSVEGVFSFLKSCQLLVTGDTSIKHLAAAAGTPIIEISLGSSDIGATGPYAENALILSAKISCRPCVHTQSCYRDRHYCSDPISPEVVAMAGRAQIDKNQPVLEQLSEEYADSVEFFLTRFTEDSLWSLTGLGMQDEPQRDAMVSRISHRHWLKHGGVGPDIGSDCFSYRNDFLGDEYIGQRQEQVQNCRQQLSILYRSLGQMVVNREKRQNIKEIKQECKKISMQKNFQEFHYQKFFRKILSHSFCGEFQQVKALRKDLAEIISRCGVEEKVIKFFAQHNLEVNSESRS